MDWLVEHWDDLVGIVGGLVIAARIIVLLIPGDTDNKYLEKIIVLLQTIGLHKQVRANEVNKALNGK